MDRATIARALTHASPGAVDDLATEIARRTRAGLRGEDLGEAMRRWAREQPDDTYFGSR